MQVDGDAGIDGDGDDGGRTVVVVLVAMVIKAKQTTMTTIAWQIDSVQPQSPLLFVRAPTSLKPTKP